MYDNFIVYHDTRVYVKVGSFENHLRAKKEKAEQVLLLAAECRGVVYVT